MIIGHPGETEKDMEELKEFLTFAKFERLGAFTYSHEEGTHAYEAYKDTIPEELKQERLNEIMALQQKISGTINEAKIGKNLKVMIDRVEGENYIGRTEFDSPEVDPEVIIPISTEGVKIGEFYSAKIIDTTDFDLYAN